MKTTTLLKTGALALSLLATHVMAAITEQEAQQLGSTLTPLGAQKAGTADGSIPAWTGGLKPNAAPVQNLFLGNPFEGDKPLFVITAANVDQYKDKLTPGQLAMFKRYPDTYRMPVYKTQRTAALPQAIYDEVRQTATKAELINEGNGLNAFSDAHYYPFPIPKSGVEVVWNHLTRYRGQGYKRESAQAAPQVNGDYTMITFEDEGTFPRYIKGDKSNTTNVLFYYKQSVVAPARLAGNVTLLHETLDQVNEPRMAWVYNAGQRRVRRAPQVSYDGPGTAADGLRTTDNADMFNGAPDRYDWKLVGKQEMYIPYNNYRLQSPTVKYSDIIKPGHINQDLTRYELHRVWHVVGTLKPNQRHIYAKRDMYFDEDTWQAAEADHYDGRGQLWRVAENFALNDYKEGLASSAAIGLYDLIAGRYLVTGLLNESRQGVDYSANQNMSDFTPAALRNAGIR
ncbi:DUF1329 domain-containing protein [Pseudomonas sp. NPDC089569]|uniref:DUF1329 domain-containing protein n=1 Tax=Pseudomonas sp. NPDC089569 TaxID=3390722 RepID=UPI003D05B929